MAAGRAPESGMAVCRGNGGTVFEELTIRRVSEYALRRPDGKEALVPEARRKHRST